MRCLLIAALAFATPAVAAAREPVPTRAPAPTRADRTDDPPTAGGENQSEAEAAAERLDPCPSRVSRLRAELLPEGARTLARLFGRGLEVRSDTRTGNDGRVRVQLRPRGSGARLRLYVDF